MLFIALSGATDRILLSLIGFDRGEHATNNCSQLAAAGKPSSERTWRRSGQYGLLGKLLPCYENGGYSEAVK